MISSTYSKSKLKARAFKLTPTSAKEGDKYIVDLFRLKRDDHDNAIYTKYGELDVQQDINSYADGCSLTALLTRCALMPSAQVVANLQQQTPGMSVDTTLLPKDLVEAFAIMRDARALVPNIDELVASGASEAEIINLVVGAKNNPEITNLVVGAKNNPEEVSGNESNESSND